MQILKQVNAAAIPRVSRTLCRACKPCPAAAACATHALVVLDADEGPWVDASRCSGCRSCILACPYGAIILDAGA